MPLARITFAEATAAIYVKKTTRGNRKVTRHATRGRKGTDRISLWRELCDIMVHNKVVLEADLHDIRACIAKSKLLSLADVQSICHGEFLGLPAFVTWLSRFFSSRCEHRRSE